MKLISKIAIVALVVVFICSCEKENLTPGNNQNSCGFGENQRKAQPKKGAGSTFDGNTVLKGEHGDQNSLDNDEIVGGGDDDRDGGSKRPKKDN